ncbi:MAG: nitrous oxide reductase accessory protein NosL [Campylobacteraceae bacterium]
MDNKINQRRTFIRKSLQLSCVFVTFSFIGCDSKVSSEPKKIKFGYDVCKRCKMLITNKNYAVQVINTKNGSHYNFDDVGCTILWFVEEKIKWQDEAIIYVKDASSSEWLKAEEAFWNMGALTPMNFGFSAYKNKQDDTQNLTFKDVESLILKKRNIGTYL